MIIQNETQLNDACDYLIQINKAITGRGTLIKPNELRSIFSSSPYIDDIKMDITTIVYNIMVDHVFDDGNKRTALVVLISLSDSNGLIVRPSDILLYHLMIDLLTGDITKEDFILKLW